MIRCFNKKLVSNKGISKEQIVQVLAMLIVITIILRVVIPISDKQKILTKTIRDNEMEIQNKFTISD